MAILGEKQKTFFFFENFIKMLKTLKRSIFYQRVYWVTNWVFFSTNTLFFALFDQTFINNPTNGHFGWKTEKRFFFWKLYQNVKNPIAFDFSSKNLLAYKLSFFSTNTPFFLSYFFQFFLLLQNLFTFWLNRDNSEICLKRKPGS